MTNSRRDLDLISSLVAQGSSVLDIGCDDGALLQRLRDERAVKGYGLEIDGARVSRAVTAGLSVVQGNADTDLADYPDQAFDTVILSNSVQALRRPDEALANAVRVGRKVIVTFPNFGHWRVRAHLALQGTMPRSRALPDTWYETDNIHLCTIKDFTQFTVEQNVVVAAAYGLSGDEAPRPFQPDRVTWTNLWSEAALFVLSRPG